MSEVFILHNFGFIAVTWVIVIISPLLFPATGWKLNIADIIPPTPGENILGDILQTS